MQRVFALEGLADGNKVKIEDHHSRLRNLEQANSKYVTKDEHKKDF